MTVQEMIGSANESALSFVSSVQDTIVDVNKSVAAALSGIVPDRPSWLASIDTPDVKELVKDSYAFQANLLDKQTSFAVALVDAWTPAKKAPAKKAAADKK
jgi:hypothetical protein